MKKVIGGRLRRARLDAYGDIPQSEFARLIGVGQSQISRWESGSTFPRLPQLVRIAERCNVPLHEILEDVAKPAAIQLKLPLAIDRLSPEARPVVLKLVRLLSSVPARRRRSA